MKKEISVLTTSEGADFLVSAFFSQCIYELKIDDADTLKDVLDEKDNWDYIDNALFDAYNKSAKSVKVTAYINADEINLIIKNIKKELSNIKGVDFGIMKFKIIDYIDFDWLELWKKNHTPISAGKYIIIPDWLRNTTNVETSKTPIYINPGNAFGTGEHESTRMCLELMSDIEFKGTNVIDVGSGSGILGIASIKSGAQSCCFLDRDSKTFIFAKENLVINDILYEPILDYSEISNKVPVEIYFLESNLMSSVMDKYDIIIANLTANYIERLSENIINYLSKDGHFVCSGILLEYSEFVKKALIAAGLTIIKEKISNNWISMLLKY